MQNKHNAPRRHHIPRMKFRVTNWAEYDAGLRRRGSLTLWVTPEVLDGWQAARRTTPGGQSSYSELAIETGTRRGAGNGCSPAATNTTTSSATSKHAASEGNQERHHAEHGSPATPAHWNAEEQDAGQGSSAGCVPAGTGRAG